MMELVAMELKRQGSYICRTLSYKGAEFKTVKDAISAEDIDLYDRLLQIDPKFTEPLNNKRVAYDNLNKC